MVESTRKPLNRVLLVVVFLAVSFVIIVSLHSCRHGNKVISSSINLQSIIDWISRHARPWETNVRKGHVWALLVAGSAGYGNYRHQADVAHSYHVLGRGGVLKEHMIVMMYDDIANSPLNPHPGTIRNHPQGPDLYQGLKRDYTGEEVNVQNFLAVLKGDDASVSKGPHASGRVIQATANDRVFVFYSDHGAPGLLGMPQGGYLYADQMHDAIRFRHAHQGFREMVLYIEACESGSMFEGLLESDMNVYATTASNGVESSWGVYCPGMDPSPPPEYMTCLGDLYSVSWMEDVDSNDVSMESLHEQYERVKKRTSNNYTFIQGSHVTEFGDLEIDYEPVSWFVGDQCSNTSLLEKCHMSGRDMTPYRANTFGENNLMYSQREADLLPLLLRADSHDESRDALERERHIRSTIDMNIVQATQHVLEHSKDILLGSLPISNSGDIHEQPIAAPSGSSVLVDDWDCLRDMIDTWESTCGTLGQYGMRHSRTFANLCNLGFDSKHILTAAEAIC